MITRIILVSCGKCYAKGRVSYPDNTPENEHNKHGLFITCPECNGSGFVKKAIKVKPEHWKYPDMNEIIRRSDG